MSRKYLSLLNSLRGRLLLLVALATIPALAFILYSASHQRDVARRQVDEDVLYLARLAAREHARQISSATTLLNTLAARPVDWTETGALSEKLFPAVASGFQYFANCGVISTSGRILVSVVPLDTPVDLSVMPVFSRALASHEVEVGDYQIGLIVHRPILFLARAVRGETAAVRAILFIALDLRWFNQLAAEADLPPGSTFTIVDRDGRILARSIDSQRWVGRHVSESADLAGIVRRGQCVLEGDDLDGVKRLFAFAPMPGTDHIHILVGIPVEQAFAASNRSLLWNLLALGFISVFAAGAGLFGAELFVLRSLRNVVDAARKLGGGDLKSRARIPSHETGEVADLARAFNVMAEALETRQAEVHAAKDRLEKNRAELRALSDRLQRAREDDSARIARDLHDELGQTLSALKLDLSWLRSRLRRAATEDEYAVLEKRVDEMMTGLDSLVEFARRIATELHPSILDRLGLRAAIEWQAREFEKRSGVRCSVEAMDPDSCDADVSIALFRICQEALTNVARHAEAKSVMILLSPKDGDALELVVRDDGRGMGGQERRSERSLGILGMHERARLVGGEFEMREGRSGGTEVVVIVPRRVGAPKEE